MSSTAEVFTETDFLSQGDAAFIRTVLDHRGVCRRPSVAEFASALDVLRRYDRQRADNPPEGDDPWGWPRQLGPEDQVALAAKAFLMFGVTKPSPAQWQRAHAALFGPLLCETCG
jgi:hypothetical protein